MLLGSVPLNLHYWCCIYRLTNCYTTPPISTWPIGHATADLVNATIPALATEVEMEAREHIALELAISTLYAMGSLPELLLLFATKASADTATVI